ncbi:MAG: Lactose transport system permease protein LacF [candidate division BRC1 bacterium ADurb.Bin183]|nr:MAG: Lactose transport system permease protein LacF [candidate division BRC1 bacterium ADurb.Bin183]
MRLDNLKHALRIFLFSILAFLPAYQSTAAPVKIRYLTWETSYEQIALVKKIIAAFEARHPNIKVQLEATTNAARIFLTDAASGAPPDVMYITNEFIPPLVEKKVLYPLDEFIKNDNVDMSIFIPQTVSLLNVEKKLYAFPIHFSTDALFYNKTLFDRSSVPYPDESWTWTDYKKYAGKLTIRNQSGRVETFGTLSPDWLLVIGSNKGRVISEDGMRCVADNPEVRQSLAFINSLSGNEAPTAAQSMDTNDMQMFANGKLAMFIGRTWQLPQISKTMKDYQWDIAPVPKGKIRFCYMAVGGNCIASGSRHKEEAWKFVQFYCSSEGQKLLGIQKNCIPALEELANSKDYFLSPPPENAKVFLDAVEYSGIVVPITEWNVEFSSRIWWPNLEKMKASKGTLTPAIVLQTIEREGNQFLERFRAEKKIFEEINANANPTSFLLYFMVILIGIGLLVLIFFARANRQYWEGYLFISPWLLGFILFALGPMLASLYLSFCNYDLLSPPKWTGLRNLSQLFSDPLFLRSLWNTLYYSAFTVPLSLFFSLLLALMLNLKIRGCNFFRAVYYLPALASGVAISLMWRWIFNPEQGLLNSFLAFWGIKGPDWLTSPTWAMPAIIIMSVWGALGGPMLIYLAGLQNIPEQLYEAAAIDGANRFHRFYHVTMPMLSPSIFFNLIMAIIGSFQVFTNVFVMTSNTAASIEPGGPANATMVYVLYLYQTGFRYLTMGKASAMAWILFMIIMAITFWNYRMSRRWVHYEQV